MLKLMKDDIKHPKKECAFNWITTTCYQNQLMVDINAVRVIRWDSKRDLNTTLMVELKPYPFHSRNRVLRPSNT